MASACLGHAIQSGLIPGVHVTESGTEPPEGGVVRSNMWGRAVGSSWGLPINPEGKGGRHGKCSHFDH